VDGKVKYQHRKTHKFGFKIFVWSKVIAEVYNCQILNIIQLQQKRYAGLKPHSSPAIIQKGNSYVCYNSIFLQNCYVYKNYLKYLWKCLDKKPVNIYIFLVL